MCAEGASMTGRAQVLVAGVGDITLSDDGFGVEVVQRLIERGGLSDGIEVVDIGLRARDLAYRLLDGYHALVLVDAISRGQDEPGTLYTLEHDLDAPMPAGAGVPQVSGSHEIDPDIVLGMINDLATVMGVERPIERAIVVACEAASFAEAIGLSPPVAAAVDRAATAVAEIATELLKSRTEEGAIR